MSDNLPEMELMKGAIDIHFHCMPDTVQRRMDEAEVAEMARDYGMRALLLKCHDTMTPDRAYYVNKMVEGIDVYGGVVLNYPVGGFNPSPSSPASSSAGRPSGCPPAPRPSTGST